MDRRKVRVHGRAFSSETLNNPRRKMGASSSTLNPADAIALFERELGAASVIHGEALASRDPGNCGRSLGAGIVLLRMKRALDARRDPQSGQDSVRLTAMEHRFLSIVGGSTWNRRVGPAVRELPSIVAELRLGQCSPQPSPNDQKDEISIRYRVVSRCILARGNDGQYARRRSAWLLRKRGFLERQILRDADFRNS